MTSSPIIRLFLCLLLPMCADPQLLQIAAHPGDDVTLPCQAPDNVAIVAVEWTRSDLERHVYLMRDGHLNTANQHPSYKNRVQLKDDEMKKGDLSLVLKKVDYTDGGTYMCRCGEEGGGGHSKLLSIVHLTVEGPGGGDQEGGGQRGGDQEGGGQRGGDQEGGGYLAGLIVSVIINVVLVVVLGVGFVIYKKPRRMFRE